MLFVEVLLLLLNVNTPRGKNNGIGESATAIQLLIKIQISIVFSKIAL